MAKYPRGEEALIPPHESGMVYRASIRKARGDQLHRETTRRVELLEWLQTHYHPVAGDLLMRLTIEAIDAPEIESMLIALRHGAAVRTKRKHGHGDQD